MSGEVVAQQWGAQAGDEEAAVVAFECAEQGAGVGEEYADAVDLGEVTVESGLDRPGVRPVGLGRLVVEGEQQVEVGDPGDGGAAGDASVEVGTVQPGAERLGDPGA